MYNATMAWWRLWRKIHSSWLIAWLSLGVVVGAVTSQYIPVGLASNISLLIGGGSLAIFSFWNRQMWVVAVIIFAGLLIGSWRGSITRGQLQLYQTAVGSEVTITGKVREDPDIGRSDALILRLNEVSINEQSAAGQIWVSVSTNLDVKRGDIVVINGKLGEGFGGFAASMYRANLERVQRPQPGDIARRVRDWFADSVRQAVSEPEASLGIGYLVGQRRALPPELDQALRITGLTHVVVASGYNLTILVRLARRLFVRVSKYLAAFSASAMTVSFIAVTGISPSMSRAGLVAGLSLLAWYYGRKFHPLVLLPFAAAVTVLINPTYGWNDLGWQLSFTAFAGVMVLAPLLQAYFFGSKKPGTLRQILGETLSAQLCTLPIIVAAFGEYSNVALIANALVLPLVPLAMLFTFIAGAGSLIIPGMSAVFGLPAEWLLSYMTSVASYLSQLPWAMSELELNSWAVSGLYAVLIVACWYMWRKTGHSLRDSNIVE